MNTQKFSIPEKYWGNFDSELAKIFLEQSEKYCVETSNTNQILTTKIERLLIISIPVAVALIGHIGNVVLGKEPFPLIMYGEVAALITLLVSIVLFLIAYSPKPLDNIGSEPRNLFTDHWTNLSGANARVDALLWLAEDYQGKIDNNISSNKNKANHIKSAIIVLVFSILMGLPTFIIHVALY